MSSDSYQIDALVIGAGVVGLAVARALSFRGRKVVIAEAENKIGTQISSRNSEVVHGGMYYPHGSLKAKCCVEGRQALHTYLLERGIFYRQCGKLIVAADEKEVQTLVALQQQGERNGMSDLRLLSGTEAKRLEPELHCIAALYSPSTGILDSHGYMMALLADAEDRGVALALRSEVIASKIANGSIRLRLRNGEAEFVCSTVVNCAGLAACKLLETMEGFPSEHVPSQYYAKGNYFAYAGKSPFTRLIYPLPDKAGLGTHLTIDAQQRAKFGPDVEWITDPASLDVNPLRSKNFYSAIRKYWPALPDGSLVADYAGIRPKLVPAGSPPADFVVQGPKTHGVAGLINMLGIESPGLTASLALADLVCSVAGL